MEPVIRNEICSLLVGNKKGIRIAELGGIIMADGISIVMIIAYSVAAFVIYHKMFSVIYIGKGGFTREIIGCLLVGFLV